MNISKIILAACVCGSVLSLSAFAAPQGRSFTGNTPGVTRTGHGLYATPGQSFSYDPYANTGQSFSFDPTTGEVITPATAQYYTQGVVGDVQQQYRVGGGTAYTPGFGLYGQDGGYGAPSGRQYTGAVQSYAPAYSFGNQ